MEVAAKLGAALALSALSPLLNKFSSKFGGDVTDEEMQHLNDFVHYEIVALTREAESDDLVQSMPLLEKLQAAALELEDLLDLYEYGQIEKQVSSSSSSNPIKKLKPIFKEKLGSILPKSRLRFAFEKLLKSVEQVEKIHPFIKSKNNTERQTYIVTQKTSTLSSPFYGRADQCDMMIKLLLNESHAFLNAKAKKVPIIAIRGLGGAGKTTTAQHIYNENKVRNYFDLRMWVHVARGFDVRKLIKETIESAAEKECGQISNLDVLQKKLKDSVSKKKFLLVLDDVWEEDTTKLDIVLSPLNQVGVKGSRIILTTRMKKAAEDVHAKSIILLDELRDEDCWSILKYYAFDGNEEIIEDHERLKYVGNRIISKVKRSPLALKVVGSSLHNKRSFNEWEKVLRQKDILMDTMDLLLYSYQCLPLRLHRCFAYCSLFPKGYGFYFDARSRIPHLIALWIAQGFIENANELTLEEVGMKYVEELISYSFFEKKSNYSFGIHDLLHDLAEKVSKKQCHRIEHHDSLHVPTTCSHLSICTPEKLSSLTISNIFKLRSLRTLIILWVDGSTNIFKSRKNIFQNLTKLRALYVQSEQEMEVLSDPHIGKLKHLRYLHVRYDSKLPVSLAKLYHLQFFILNTNLLDSGVHLKADAVPQGFGNLINLRTLQFYRLGGGELNYLYYNSKMLNIEELRSLQNLEEFHLDGFNKMISLRNLPLCGSLSILNLENIKCKEKAEEAMLYKKKNLNELIFKWSSTSNDNSYIWEDVLEGLEPHQNLKKLEINGYQGVKFSKWMMKENWLPCLQTLNLQSCTSLKIVSFLPPLLQSLVVENCHELMQLPSVGDTLRTLCLTDCPKLTPPSIFNKSLDRSDLPYHTNLERLSLKEFPNLQALTSLSPTVTELTIGDCPKLTNLGNLQQCTSLQWLAIYKCPMLRREEPSLVEGVVQENVSNRLPQVDSFWTDKPLLVFELVQQQAFGSITNLTLTDCCVALPNLEKLSSLWGLYICNCPEVESLPNLPVSLRSLRVHGCPKMKERYQEGGPLRNTISHIPRIHIY